MISFSARVFKTTTDEDQESTIILKVPKAALPEVHQMTDAIGSMLQVVVATSDELKQPSQAAQFVTEHEGANKEASHG